MIGSGKNFHFQLINIKEHYSNEFLLKLTLINENNVVTNKFVKNFYSEIYVLNYPINEEEQIIFKNDLFNYLRMNSSNTGGGGDNSGNPHLTFEMKRNLIQRNGINIINNFKLVKRKDFKSKINKNDMTFLLIELKFPFLVNITRQYLIQKGYLVYGTHNSICDSFVFKSKCGLFDWVYFEEEGREIEINQIKLTINDSNINYLKLYLFKEEEDKKYRLVIDNNNKIKFESIKELNLYLTNIPNGFLLYSASSLSREVNKLNYDHKINVDEHLYSKYSHLDHLNLIQLINKVRGGEESNKLDDEILKYCEKTFNIVMFYIYMTNLSRCKSLNRIERYEKTIFNRIEGKYLVKYDENYHHHLQEKTKGGKKASFKGGLVLNAKVGYYETPLVILDFDRFYPNIIIQHNICFSTCSNCYHSSSNELLSFNQDILGIIPLECKQKIQKRIGAQIAGNKTLELAIKEFINSIYGNLGTSNNLFSCIEIAETITSHGREYLKQVSGMVNNLIGGDTDSIMFLLDKKETPETIALTINNSLPKYIKMSIDSICEKSLILNNKQRVQIDFLTGNIINKGVITRNMNEFTQNLCLTMLKLKMHENKSLVEIESFILKELSSLKDNYRQLKHYKKLSKNIEFYDKNSFIYKIGSCCLIKDVNDNKVISYYYLNGEAAYGLDVNNFNELNIDMYLKEIKQHLKQIMIPHLFPELTIERLSTWFNSHDNKKIRILN